MLKNKKEGGFGVLREVVVLFWRLFFGFPVKPRRFLFSLMSQCPALHLPLNWCFFFLFPPTGLFLTLPYNFTTRGTLYSFLLTYAELRGIHESKRQHQVERRGVKGRSEATGRRLFFVTKAKDLISSCHLMDGELKELDAYALPFYRTNTTTRA